MSNNNVFYISPDEVEKDEDGDVIMTDYVEDKNTINISIIDGDTTSVSTHNENDDNDYDDDNDNYYYNDDDDDY